MSPLLLCTDLDRTLIPNGNQPESPGARTIFSRFVSREEVGLVYVSGRHLALIEQAIEEYQLPLPDVIIADVGSTIYRFEQGVWQQWRAWDEAIAEAWQGMSAEALHSLLEDITALQLQEQEKQNTHKLSYYLPVDGGHQAVIADIEARLSAKGVRSNLIWSVDEIQHIGLLDILPADANKLHAITFLMQHDGYDDKHVVFSGDSGNDLDVLLSPVQAILVANADDEVRAAVKAAAPENIYVAKGNFLHMNGCYSAGILEGVAYYRPEYMPLIEAMQ
ncbi:HAD-IIB family hydrolase [Mariprofundus ferrooxydans]|uniref:HAD-IIB family hydrolase n=1 Tax=Mariprofundus ferrooxydans TaxID=314344 RepID=UPI00036D6C1A|nr:HAD-IIB family hydrolase [Mariprofundus ferrooxydans]